MPFSTCVSNRKGKKNAFHRVLHSFLCYCVYVQRIKASVFVRKGSFKEGMEFRLLVSVFKYISRIQVIVLNPCLLLMLILIRNWSRFTGHVTCQWNDWRIPVLFRVEPGNARVPDVSSQIRNRGRRQNGSTQHLFFSMLFPLEKTTS